MQREQWSTRRRKRRKRRKGRGKRLTCGGCLAVMRRFGRWLSRLRWREWWPVSIAGEGRRKVAGDRGSAARLLYEVFGRLLVMEREVFKPVVTMLVAECHGGERERERSSASSKNRLGRLVFLLSLDPNFSIPGA
jgi:hypothetical protein